MPNLSADELLTDLAEVEEALDDDLAQPSFEQRVERLRRTAPHCSAVNSNLPRAVRSARRAKPVSASREAQR